MSRRAIDRDKLTAALAAHRNNDVFVHAEVYASPHPNDLKEVKRLAVTGVVYDPITDCLVIEASEDYD